MLPGRRALAERAYHLPDFWKGLALERIARIQRPGGVLRLRDIAFSFVPDEALLGRAGSEIVDVVYAESRVFAAYTCIRRG